MNDVSQVVTLQQPGASSLSVTFTWALAGNAVYSGGQWAMLALLAKLTRPEIVGQYALGLAIALPVIMLTTSQLRCLLPPHVHARTHSTNYLPSPPPPPPPPPPS